MYFRIHDTGHNLSNSPFWYASDVRVDQPRGAVHRTLHNQTGHIGPLPGDMARPGFGLINGDLGAVVGDREAGLGRNWERLHLIGVSAGHLNERRYSNYNTLIGSHAMNTAMIPFEGIANWVIQQPERSFYYIVNIDEQRRLVFTDRNGNQREEFVPYVLRQAISYTAAPPQQNIWITIEQTHVDRIVERMADGTQIDYEANIQDNRKMNTQNYRDVQAAINTLDQQIIAAQNSAIWNLHIQF